MIAISNFVYHGTPLLYGAAVPPCDSQPRFQKLPLHLQHSTAAHKAMLALNSQSLIERFPHQRDMASSERLLDEKPRSNIIADSAGPSDQFGSSKLA